MTATLASFMYVLHTKYIYIVYKRTQYFAKIFFHKSVKLLSVSKHHTYKYDDLDHTAPIISGWITNRAKLATAQGLKLSEASKL